MGDAMHTITHLYFAYGRFHPSFFIFQRSLYPAFCDKNSDGDGRGRRARVFREREREINSILYVEKLYGVFEVVCLFLFEFVFFGRQAERFGYEYTHRVNDVMTPVPSVFFLFPCFYARG